DLAVQRELDAQRADPVLQIRADVVRDGDPVLAVHNEERELAGLGGAPEVIVLGVGLERDTRAQVDRRLADDLLAVVLALELEERREPLAVERFLLVLLLLGLVRLERVGGAKPLEEQVREGRRLLEQRLEDVLERLRVGELRLGLLAPATFLQVAET